MNLAVEATETGIWAWDIRTGAVTWSAECYRIHRMQPGDFGGTGDDFFRLVHPDDAGRVRAAVGQAIAARELYEAEFRILRNSPSLDCRSAETAIAGRPRDTAGLPAAT